MFDVRAVGVFRILLAGTILFDQCVRVADWGAFHSASSLVSAADSRAWDSPWVWSVYWLSDGPLLPVALEVLRTVASLALLVGIRSRLAAFVLFVILASVAARNPLFLQGGDRVLIVMTFFAVFLPLGQRFSLSRLWFAETPPPHVCSAATVAFAVQVLLVWFMSGILKIGEPWCVDGTAISMALHLELFATEFARLWRHWDWLAQPLTLFVFWLECLAPLLALIPVLWCRIVGLAALVILEVAIFLSLEVGLFPLISLVSLVPLVPVPVVDRLAAGLARRQATSASLVLFFDRDCRFCAFACRLLLACCGKRDAVLREAQSHPVAARNLAKHFAWSVAECSRADATSPADRYQRGWGAVLLVLQRSPRPWLARFLPGAVTGEVVYGWIGRNRGGIGHLGGMVFGHRHSSGLHGEAGRFVAAAALVVVLAWNAVTHPATLAKLDLRPLVQPLAAALNVQQYWNMFAPQPYDQDVWWAIPALRRGGGQGNLLTGKPVALTPPRDGADRYGGYRWRKITSRSVMQGQFERVAGYFCRTGHWAAVDVWEFSRPNLGVAATADAPYEAERRGRWRCDEFDGVDAVDDDAVRAFHSDVDHRVRELDGVLRGF